MLKQYVTLPAGKHAASEPCPCGCAECTRSCCGLECLERPRFFCGQLLTDQDLTALLDWTQGKFRLGRFHHGWGVVCGLGVAADIEYARRRSEAYTSRIVVSPGYAVSCCGDDIVVCDPLTVDLGPAFENGKHRCEDPRVPTEEDNPDASIYLGEIRLNPSDVRIVDLFLRRQEELIGPQPVLAGACGQAGGCEYTRTREGAQIDWQCVPVPPTDPLRNEATQWQKKFDAAVQLLDEFEAEAEIQRAQWLRNHFEAQPWQYFRFARLLANIDPQNVPENYTALLFWLVQERRSSMLLGDPCYECADAHGIPLARVWLRASYNANFRRMVDVLHIDTAAPYRRPRSAAQRWPAPAGEINLAQFIWQRPEAAYAAFSAWQIEADRTPCIIGDLESLRKDFGDTIFASYGDHIQMNVYADTVVGERIVGFHST